MAPDQLNWMPAEWVAWIPPVAWQWLVPGLLCLVILLVVLLVRARLASARTASLTHELREELSAHRLEMQQGMENLRASLTTTQRDAGESVVGMVGRLGETQGERLQTVEKSVRDLSTVNEARMEKLRESVEKQVVQMRADNERKLEEMRRTVDDKLQTTLEKRLGESFKVVSERLEAVQRGLGEMQNLASGVGDLKRVLTNVKTRGTWGEYRVGALLEQLLTPDQFDRNVAVKPESAERVEFAIRMPGPDSDPENCIWLPVDSKFPQEDYQRLVDAAEAADKSGVEAAEKALASAVEKSARDIRDKYLSPPDTTDFGILFLPTEGLYAEVLRHPGLMEKLQQTYRVVVTGPMTFSAILSSLQMGFRTLAIEKRSSEVWKVLAAVKTEFGKFAEVMGSLKKQLDTASRTIEEKVTVRTRQMERRLREVEELPSAAARRVLTGRSPFPGEAAENKEDTEQA